MNRLAHDMSLNWVDILGLRARRDPDGVALRFDRRSITWAELDRRTGRLATVLASMGVAREDRVLLLLSNRPEFVEAMIAVHKIGAIAVPVNFRLVAHELAYLVEHSEASVAVVEGQFLEIFRRAVGNQREGFPTLVVAGQQAGENFGNAALDYEGALGASAVVFSPIGVELSTAALIMYTSGTTGRPKGAMLSYQNLMAQCMTLVQVLPYGLNPEVGLVTTPVFHIAAISALIPNIVLGYTSVIAATANFDPETFLDLMESEKVTNVFLVPTQWDAVCSSPTVSARKLRLRSIVWGGAPASLSLLKAMRRTFPGVPIICTFGQTEMSPISAALPADMAEAKIGSIGRPVPLVAARIEGPDGAVVNRGEVGEIVYQGPSTMLGYWADPGATSDAFRGGWFHSGDLVREDEDGYLYIVGRLKEMIISGGENIYPAEIETALSEHPDVVEVAVFGVPDPKWGQTPVAAIVSRDPESPPSSEELTMFLVNRIASYKKPSRFVAVSELPRNASGKVVTNVLKDQHANASGSGTVR